MGKAASLFMWPGSFEQPFFSASEGVSTWNLTLILIGLMGFGENMFENVDGRTMDAYPYAYYKLTNEPLAQES